MKKDFDENKNIKRIDEKIEEIKNNIKMNTQNQEICNNILLISRELVEEFSIAYKSDKNTNEYMEYNEQITQTINKVLRDLINEERENSNELNKFEKDKEQFLQEKKDSLENQER